MDLGILARSLDQQFNARARDHGRSPDIHLWITRIARERQMTFPEMDHDPRRLQ